MLRHIVTWNYKEGFSEAENKENALKMKQGVEALTGCVPGVIELKVYINELASSNKDVVLNSLFEDEKALADYQVHPEHQKMAAFIGIVMQDRACIDYYE